MAYPPKTPSGKKVILTPTTRPNEDPEKPEPTGDEIVDESSQPSYPIGADLADETKVRLGDYLSATTLGHGPSNKGNAYPIQAGHRQISMDDAGRPTKIITGGQNRSEQPTFAAGNSQMTTMPQEATVTLERYSNSGRFDAAEPESKRLIDVVQKNAEKSGSNLFADIKPNDSNTSGLSVQPLPPNAPLIQQKVEGILSTNRFSGTERTPYINDGDFSQDNVPDQGKFGVYDASGAQADAPWGGKATRDSLQLVGHSLLMKATGHDDDPVRDPTSGASYTAALLPSFVQLIVKKANADNLRAKTAYGAPNVKTLTKSDLRLESRDSFGALNNPHEPFAEGLIPAGMVSLCITGMGTLVLATAAVSSIIQLARSAPPIPPIDIPDGPEEAFERGGAIIMGRSRQSATTSNDTGGKLQKLFERLGFPMDIMDKLDRAMVLGIRAFYGLGMSSDATLLGVMDGVSIDTAFNLVEAAGYYAGIIRHAVRDLHAYTEKVKAVGEKFSRNPIAGVEGALAIIADFFQLNSFKFLMVMAKIGSRRLDAHEKNFSSIRLPINDIKENPVSKIFKSRQKADVRKLVWRHGSNSSRYLLPKSFRTAMLQTPLGAEAGVASRFDPTVVEFANKVVNLAGTGTSEDDMLNNPDEASKINSLSGIRIDPKLVQIVENKLEMEYMPFYFHDIRTNEIIAFNAFIESIKDSFKPDYTQTDGYGRMDPVMIYKKTTRSISVDFHLVSTSFEDFNIMWWDINKLTTLIYPQWSRGTPVTSGQDNFIMPFSQIPTASPMIRMRIGDVVKTNYSKLALARLFGAGIPSKLEGVYNIGAEGTADQWEYEGTKYNDLESAEQAQAKKTAQLEAKFKQMPFDKNSPEGPQPGEEYFVLPGSTIHVHPSSQTARTRARTMKDVETIDSAPAEFKVKVLQTYIARFKAGRTEVKYECEFIPGVSEVFNPMENDPKAIIHLAKEQLTMAPPKTKIKMIRGQNPSSMDEFYGPNNSIIRSFEQGMGRGLAGFITGFDIDWDESPWEVVLGSRAPQTVKISITFSPIHDIAPGIDHDGFNRAPIYNVGDLIKPVAQDAYGQVVSAKLNPQSSITQNYLKLRKDIGKGGSPEFPMGKGKTDAP